MQNAGKPSAAVIDTDTEALADTLLQFQHHEQEEERVHGQRQLLACPAVIAAFQMTFKYFPQSRKLSENME